MVLHKTFHQIKSILIYIIVLILCIFLLGCLDSQKEERVVDPQIEHLVNLGYLSWSDIDVNASRYRGVTKNNNMNYQDVLNVYSVDEMGSIELIDHEGNIRTSINIPISFDSPDIEFLGNNTFIFLAIHQNLSGFIQKRNLKGDVFWVINSNFHHDFYFGDEIVALDLDYRNISYNGREYEIEDNDIVFINLNGTEKERIALSDLFFEFIDNETIEQLLRIDNLKKTVSKKALRKIQDVFHSNNVEILKENTKIGKPGDILVCIRDIDLIAVIDRDNKKIVWKYGPGILERPHDPEITDQGNILIFDNGYFRNYSRIIEIEPITKEIVWEYKGKPPSSFFSRTRGGIEILQNGNYLITESNRGRAFEINRENEILWEFYSPYLNEENNSRKVFQKMKQINKRLIY